MSKRLDFVELQWRRTKRIFAIVPFWILLIFSINVWQDAQAGRPFNPNELLYAGGMIAASTAVFLFAYLIFKFVRAYVQHEERNSR